MAERSKALAAVPEATSDAPVYDAIYEAVMEHRLAPGARLTEASLCEIFGVSRAVVRMALLRLSHDRIVTLIPNRGAAIARPSVRETRDVFELRAWSKPRPWSWWPNALGRARSRRCAP
jgi:DNA-binding GntR family transcriptional regulator